MKKKILLSVFALVAVVAGVAGMSAYEAHVINVTAHIENALAVSTNAIEFGTVFPQEYLEETFTVALSESFLGEGRVDDVHYVIKQKPKCECDEWDTTPESCNLGQYAPVDYATHACPTGYAVMNDLCKFLSKTPVEDDGDTAYPSYYSNVDGIIGNGDDSCRAFGEPLADASGYLVQSEGDVSDTWIVDLKVPPVDGTIGQDWPLSCALWTVPVNDVDYGCDLWVEITDISLTPEVEMRHISLENKDMNDGWSVISDDRTWGDIDYSHNAPNFYGTVTGKGLVANAPYQITLNGPGSCTFTDDGLANVSTNAFSSGYWNSGPNLDDTCVTGGEGVYNIDLTGTASDPYWYTVWTDSSGDFSYSFTVNNLPVGDYVGVKVLVKQMLDPFVTPWAELGTDYAADNLYETAAISFTIVP